MFWNSMTNESGYPELGVPVILKTDDGVLGVVQWVTFYLYKDSYGYWWQDVSEILEPLPVQELDLWMYLPK